MWTSRRRDVLESADRITGLLQQSEQAMTSETLDLSVLTDAYHQLTAQFDRQHGGFGEAPKFPTPHNLYFLLRTWKRTGNSQALAMVEQTLRRMRRGGIYDHVGFGFHRYSVGGRR